MTNKPKDYGPMLREAMRQPGSPPETGGKGKGRDLPPWDYGPEFSQQLRRGNVATPVEGGSPSDVARPTGLTDYGPYLARRIRAEESEGQGGGSADSVSPRSVTPTRRTRSGSVIGSPVSPGAGSDPFVSAQGSVDEDEPRPKRSAAGANSVFNQSDRPRDDVEQMGDVPGFEQVEFEQFGVEQIGLEQSDLRSGADQIH